MRRNGKRESGGAVMLRGADGRVLVAEVRTARGFPGRALGLMGRAPLAAGMGLRLAPCAAVHTGFMRFPLDLVFLDSAGRVVRVVRGARPWRVFRGGRGAVEVIETTAGVTLPSGRPAPGETVRFSSAPESSGGR